jgi:DegV family protein with EDD domain
VIKIVTDSGSDISTELARELGITIVPLYIYFGEKVYKDGVDIGPDELYKKLEEDPVHPSTTQPMPSDFASTYDELARDCDGIVSVHLSSKVSGTYNAALQGSKITKSKCEIHVIDSFSLSVGLGMIATAAARLARAGGNMAAVLDEIKKAMSQTQLRGLVDTLHYLLKGGRITKVRALVGTLLNVKPILAMREGELVQVGMTRSYSKGIEQLLEFVKNYPDLHEVAIAHSTVPVEAESLKKDIVSRFNVEQVPVSRIGAGLGVHGGPGVLIVAARSR